MRESDFWQRMEEVFGGGYAASVARDHVLPQLGRTVAEALAAGTDARTVWRAVVAAYPERVPARLR